MKSRIVYPFYFLALGWLLLLACNNKEPVPVPVPPPPVFAKGADISWVTEMESAGRSFYTAAGQPQECMQLLKSLGMNSIRIRVWVNPAGGWNNMADVIAKALRAKNLGMRIMIDFHYSDTWADPGQQTIPAAWAAMDLTAMQTAVYNHTYIVLDNLKQSGVTPEWVQVGNEVNNGMLWPMGKASVNMASFAALFKQGYSAVKAVYPDAKVILHLSNGFDNALYRWLLDGLKTNGAGWDVTGMSLYPDPANWQTTNSQCLANVNDMISRYQKPVMICETGMSWDQPTASYQFHADLIAKMKAVPNNMGLGVFYWEPESYNNWQGYTLGAFDNSGKPTHAMDAFQ
ncbi:MAG: glycosyl hydrolase 53 family protein [Chitinophagaceae bacterium]|nr:glycosyl hydrolase 53 family protein [Chitinophagaceae bacterium]